MTGALIKLGEHCDELTELTGVDVELPSAAMTSALRPLIEDGTLPEEMLDRAVERALQAGVADLKTDVADLKTDVAELKTDVAELKTDVAELKLAVQEILRRLPPPP